MRNAISPMKTAALLPSTARYRNTEEAYSTNGVEHWGRVLLETRYNNDFIVAKFIDLLPDDIVARWRRFVDDDGTMQEVEEKHGVRKAISGVLKSSRLYGGAVLLMITREAPLETPLDPQMIRKDDLIRLTVADRFSVHVASWNEDFLSPDYGKPDSYNVYFGDGLSLEIHASRVLRFDAIPRHLSDIIHGKNDNWGLSVLSQVQDVINQDVELVKATGRLVAKSSIDVMKIDGFKEALAASSGAVSSPDEASLDEVGENINELQNLYNITFLDTADSYERHPYSFSGIGDIYDRYARRLASALGVPMTRFWGASPMGLNATGDSDLRNYAMQILAMQQNLLSYPLERLDAVLSRSAGLSEPLEYEWVPLVDMSEEERAKVAVARMQAVTSGLAGGVIDEVEAREALQREDVFGHLDPEEVPPPPEPDPNEGFGNGDS